MTLRLKINLIVGLLTLAFTLGLLVLQLRTLRDGVYEETAAANRVAAQLLHRTAWLQAAQGTPAMLAFLQGVGRVRSNDISLYDREDRELYRSPPSPYKAGRDAPAWFEELVAPRAAEQSIAFPDGRLVVRANASRAALDAWDYMLALTGGAALLLLAVNAAVSWLVGRAVRPFGQVVNALNAVEAGRLDAELPAMPGREASAVRGAFNRMLAQLRERIEVERRAAAAEAQLSDSRDLARWIDRRLEDERRAIARELHDEFGQSVTAMRSLALSIANRAPDADTAATARVVADEASRLYDAMHGVIPRLAPLTLDRFGLAAAIDDLLERTRRAHADVILQSDVHLDDGTIDPERALTLYRAAQEGLSNALRHAQPRRLLLGLAGDASAWTLTVDDDGIGVSAPGVEAGAGHHGLRWLRERAEGLGGQVSIGPGPLGGARLQLRLPRA